MRARAAVLAVVVGIMAVTPAAAATEPPDHAPWQTFPGIDAPAEQARQSAG